MGLPFDFTETINDYASPTPFEAYEKIGGYKSGRWVYEIVEGSLRTIDYAIVLEVDEETLEILEDGDAISEGYVIMFDKATAEPFSIVKDLQGQTVNDQKQTYVAIDGLEFIVKKNYGTQLNSNFYSYFALRYKEVSNV